MVGDGFETKVAGFLMGPGLKEVPDRDTFCFVFFGFDFVPLG